MSVLTSYFNKDVNQNSKDKDCYDITFKKGKNGEDIATFEKINFQEIQKMNGTIDDWSVEAMLKAGINPKDMTPNTTFNTRIESVYSIEQLNRDLDSLKTNNDTK